MPAEAERPEFSRLLRHWRRTRGFSQLELAERAGMSSRHLSFLETGRCGPSRDAVQQLARALALPRSENERLLLVAGYAGDWTHRALDSAGIRAQIAKFAHLLDAHDPFPAVISDPEWRIAWQNRGARAFLERVKELGPGPWSDPLDLRQLLSEGHGFGRVVKDFAELLQAVLAGLYQLAPDPACFGNARALMDVLPGTDRPGPAIDRAIRSTVWSHELQLSDAGVEFPLELVTLPFAAGASGYALVVTRPVAATDWPRARAYFEGLVARLP
jgi:transcriptional regulator with XRE-family HTH domain